jgi:hypothetical protein
MREVDDEPRRLEHPSGLLGDPVVVFHDQDAHGA